MAHSVNKGQGWGNVRGVQNWSSGQNLGSWGSNFVAGAGGGVEYSSRGKEWCRGMDNGSVKSDIVDLGSGSDHSSVDGNGQNKNDSNDLIIVTIAIK